MPRRSSWLLVSAFALVAGCSKGGEKAATPGTDTTAAAAPTSPEPKKGIATEGFKKVADDLNKFATGGLTGMVATTTNPHEAGSGEAPAAIFTVIYKTPKDTAAFEKYYAEKHIPLVVASQDQIGFERAELTKFNSNLDGSKPARYRQAELYFPSMDALKKGVATPAFKGVADDLPKFATGGFDALVAVETK